MNLRPAVPGGCVCVCVLDLGGVGLAEERQSRERSEKQREKGKMVRGKRFTEEKDDRGREVMST